MKRFPKQHVAYLPAGGFVGRLRPKLKGNAKIDTKTPKVDREKTGREAENGTIPGASGKIRDRILPVRISMPIESLNRGTATNPESTRPTQVLDQEAVFGCRVGLKNRTKPRENAENETDHTAKISNFGVPGGPRDNVLGVSRGVAGGPRDSCPGTVPGGPRDICARDAPGRTRTTCPGGAPGQPVRDPGQG